MIEVSKEINVHIGEVKTARRGEKLKTILGSCVGIGFLWKKNEICGLAHCLLPKAPAHTFQIGGRFVDQAVMSLMMLMRIKPEDLGQIDVIVAGGGNMTQPDVEDSSSLVGGANIKMAISEIEKVGLRIVKTEFGGEKGKKITIDSKNCTYTIESIPRIIGAG